MRIEAPSTGHSIAGRSGSPVGSISMAPKPPVSASSIACSINVRKLSAGFGSSSVRRSARSLRCRKGHILRPHSAPHPHLPVHGRDAILDHVDRPPHHRRLRKPAQIHRRRLGQMLARKLHRTQNRRQRQRLALRLCPRLELNRSRKPDLAGLLPMARLPPHLPQLLAYLHAHLPSKAIGKKRIAKTKGMAIGHAFFHSSVFRVQLRNPRSVPQPIAAQSRLNRSSIAPGHNHEIPEIHQQDSSYREARKLSANFSEIIFRRFFDRVNRSN